MSVKIVLLVDNPFRDLPGLVLLARRLCQEGAVCCLVPTNLRDREVWPLAPDYVLMNHLRTVNQEFARQAIATGMRVGVLDTEGGVMTCPDVFARTMAPDQSVRHGISDFFSWGHKLAGRASEKGWYLPEQVSVTGHPRLDYYVEPWRRGALRISEYADELPQPMVLINGAFPLANPQFKTPEREASMLVNRFGYDEGEVREWQNRQGQTMRQMAELSNRLASRFPETTFVYRPHPFEKLETYDELLERRENLHAIKKGTVDGWILRAAAVIQRSCSTAIEAGLAGVPALSPVWIPVAVLQPAAEAVSIACHSEEELVEHLRAALEARLTIPEVVRTALDQVIHDWFHKIDGRSHQRVAERILETLRDGTERVSLKRCRQVVYGRGRRDAPLVSRLASRVRENLGISMHWSFRRWRHEVPALDWHRTEKYYDAAQVRVVMDALEACQAAEGAAPRHGVGVQSATEHGDYHFGYRQGRSVTLFPRP